MRAVWLIAGLVALVTSTAVLADEVQEWINKMSSSGQQGNYEGTFVFWRDHQLEAMRVQHGSQDGNIWESLESLNDEPRRLIHNNGKVTSIFPQRQLVTVSDSGDNLPFHPDLPKNLDKLNEFYDLQVVGDGRVAGQPTRIIAVKPRDGYRYGFQYWLDKSSGMMLRCDVLDEKQNVLEQVMFTEFKPLPSPPDNAFSQAEVPTGYKRLEQMESQVLSGGQSWLAERLPAGFTLTKNMIKPMHSHHGTVQQMVYSDGLATVSVFVEKGVAEEQRLSGHSRMGSVNAYGVRIDDHQVTVVGEVPLDTVKYIASSIRHAK